LLIAVLLRFMDSFMIYTEPFVVTGGGPGNTTTFLSIDLVKMASRPVRPRPCRGRHV
jgi:glycerol transport system permease protein